MLVPKKNRRVIYSMLFKEGVMVAKKDLSLPKHPHMDVPNLHVVKLMQSLESRGFVAEKFNWQWHYWTLTNEGIEYLREYLHVPAEVMPDTLKKQSTKPSLRELSRIASPPTNSLPKPMLQTISIRMRTRTLS